MALKNKKEESKDAEIISAIGEPAKSIPKLATNVNILRQSDGKVILRFFSKVADEPFSLIETFIIDENHAQQIVDVLSGVLKQKFIEPK
ncbi:hypothetical protein N8083_00360 [Candidatus Pacebacteria bacterium]|nr:hypothetical protein [Candidatus Paceibacterota bacterium]